MKNQIAYTRYLQSRVARRASMIREAEADARTLLMGILFLCGTVADQEKVSQLKVLMREKLKIVKHAIAMLATDQRLDRRMFVALSKATARGESLL